MSNEHTKRHMAMCEAIRALGIGWAADQIMALRDQLEESKQEANRAWHRENERDNGNRGVGY